MSPEEIWDSYNSKLKTYIMKHVPDKYEAEDILQEVGIRIQKNAGRIKDIDNIGAWLYRIAYNLIADYFRREKKCFLVQDINEIHGADTSEQENFNKEAAACLLKLAEYLPETYKDAIIESDYKGRKQCTLSQKWGLSYSGSKTRIQRARKKLKTELLKCCEIKFDNAGNIIELQNKDNNSTKYSCIGC